MSMEAIESRIHKIGDGDKGIYDTVDYMWHYALRDSKEALVKQLVRKLTGRSKLETIANIYSWVIQNVRYELDPPDMEEIKTPLRFVTGDLRAGDCDCMTTLLVCLLETAGFDCSIVVIAWRLDAYTHVFCEVWYDGRWFILDPTLKKHGFGKQDKNIRRFKRITKREMNKVKTLSDTPKMMRPIPNRNCRRNANDDWNKNVNNININFGTTTENAYNNSDSRSNYSNGGKAVEVGSLPPLHSVYNGFRHRPQAQQRPIILSPRPNGSGYDIVNNISRPVNIVNNQGSTGNKTQILTKNGNIVRYSVPSKERNFYVEFP